MHLFLAGFAAGVGLGVLFAPRCGAEARGYLKRQTGEAKESALDLMDRSREAMLRQIERLAAVQPADSQVYQR